MKPLFGNKEKYEAGRQKTEVSLLNYVVVFSKKYLTKEWK